MNRGLFITFEGPEGGGKSTQSKLLVDKFKSLGRSVISTREPGGTEIGEKIRNILLDPENKKMGELSELLLYEASRSQHVHELIKPALEQGTDVICDRFKYASTAYQGYGRNLGVDLVEQLNEIATYSLQPDLTIILDINPEIGLKMAFEKSSKIFNGQLDRLEQENIEFHHKVRNGYLEIAKENPQKIKVIDYGKSIEKIHTEIFSYIKPLINSNNS